MKSKEAEWKKKIEENKQKRLEERKKANEALPPSKTLFVRNISYETTQEDFKNFFSTFGPLKYALLCKSSQDSEAHKGTGFVAFRDPVSADKLIELSKQIESRLDKECKE